MQEWSMSRWCCRMAWWLVLSSSVTQTLRFRNIHTYIHTYIHTRIVHVNGLYHFSSNCCLCVCTLHAYLPTFVAGDVWELDPQSNGSQSIRWRPTKSRHRHWRLLWLISCLRALVSHDLSQCHPAQLYWPSLYMFMVWWACNAGASSYKRYVYMLLICMGSWTRCQWICIKWELYSCTLCIMYYALLSTSYIC